jgi:hypothetical protein
VRGLFLLSTRLATIKHQQKSEQQKMTQEEKGAHEINKNKQISTEINTNK